LGSFVQLVDWSSTGSIVCLDMKSRWKTHQMIVVAIILLICTPLEPQCADSILAWPSACPTEFSTFSDDMGCLRWCMTCFAFGNLFHRYRSTQASVLTSTPRSPSAGFPRSGRMMSTQRYRLTCGLKLLPSVLVLHPVESLWLHARCRVGDPGLRRGNGLETGASGSGVDFSSSRGRTRRWGERRRCRLRR